MPDKSLKDSTYMEVVEMEKVEVRAGEDLLQSINTDINMNITEQVNFCWKELCKE